MEVSSNIASDFLAMTWNLIVAFGFVGIITLACTSIYIFIKYHYLDRDEE